MPSPCSIRLICGFDNDIIAVSEPEKKAEKHSKMAMKNKIGRMSSIQRLVIPLLKRVET